MRIVFSVTNDLSYDQRMQRICDSLATHGFSVLLVGRALPHSIPLKDRSFEQKRLACFFKKGFLFYAEYNLRLFFFLLFLRSYDTVCSIDLDTLPAGFLASVLRRKKRVFDAHEYFTEVPEVVGRPVVRTFWGLIARCILPFYRHAYTVGPSLAGIFERLYGIPFAVIRNVAPRQASGQSVSSSNPKIILYQGALNEGRGLEAAISAMQNIENVQLVLAGEGDLSDQLRELALSLQLGDKVRFLGYVEPAALKDLTASAWLGLNLLENRGKSYYYSLANKFFDCVQAHVPILTMDFPEYRALNAVYEVAVLLPGLTGDAVAESINKLLKDNQLYDKLQHNCQLAAEVWTWEKEAEKLVGFWRQV